MLDANLEGFKLNPESAKMHCIDEAKCKGIYALNKDQPCKEVGYCKNGGICYDVFYVLKRKPSIPEPNIVYAVATFTVNYANIHTNHLKFLQMKYYSV